MEFFLSDHIHVVNLQTHIADLAVSWRIRRSLWTHAVSAIPPMVAAGYFSHAGFSVDLGILLECRRAVSNQQLGEGVVNLDGPCRKRAGRLLQSKNWYEGQK